MCGLQSVARFPRAINGSDGRFGVQVLNALRSALDEPALSRELEVGDVLRAVYEGHIEAARPRPGLVRLPDVDILVAGRVVREAATSGTDCLLDGVERRGGIAVDAV